MSVLQFVKEHKDDTVRAAAALLLCGIMAAFILAFNAGKLPHSDAGDAFDTIYALEQPDSAS